LESNKQNRIKNNKNKKQRLSQDKVQLPELSLSKRNRNRFHHLVIEQSRMLQHTAAITDPRQRLRFRQDFLRETTYNSSVFRSKFKRQLNLTRHQVSTSRCQLLEKMS